MKKNVSAKCISILAIIISILTVGLEIWRICVENPRTDELNWDYIGIIVGFLSILVTVLIGWQIYSMISVKQEIREIDSKNKFMIERSSTEYEKLSSAVYLTIFNEIGNAKDNTYTHYKYGLLTILHTSMIPDLATCRMIIKQLENEIKITTPLSCTEKAEILTLANKIMESSAREIFDDLYPKLRTEIKISD